MHSFIPKFKILTLTYARSNMIVLRDNFFPNALKLRLNTDTNFFFQHVINKLFMFLIGNIQ